MKNLILILSVFTMLFIGCNDLEEEVYSTLTEDGFEYKSDDILNVTGTVYQILRELHGHVGYSHMNTTSTDILVMPANASGWDDGGRYKRIHLHTWNAEADQIKSAWSVLYKGIINANRIIEQIESEFLPVPPDVSREELIAEMKTARAFYYWLLIDDFGDVPFVTTVTQVFPSITSRETIYTSVVADIVEAVDILSSENNTSTYGRFNEWAAKALLANLYLNAGVYTGNPQWNKCLSECNDIIASGLFSLEPNYVDCFDADNNNSVETIFAIPYDEIYGRALFINYTFHASSRDKYELKSTPWGAGSYKAISQFIDTYDPDDSRLDDTWEHGLQFASDGVTPLLCTYDRAGEQLNFTKDLPDGLYTLEDEGYRVKKFLPEMGAEFYMNNDIPFFRYAQVLMMKAECLLRTGHTHEAAIIITELRERAFISNPEKAIVSGAQLAANSKYSYGYIENYVVVDPGDQTPVEFGGFYDELGYEFACEWGYRRRDMIRFGTYTTKSWLSHKPQGDKTKVFPLPQSSIDANPNLEQNPDY